MDWKQYVTNLGDRLGDMFGLSTRPPGTLATPGLRDSIESARKAKLSERYPEALEAIDRALALVQAHQDSAGEVVLLLQKADVYIRMGSYDEAAQTLDRALVRAGDQKVQVAYLIATRGVMALAQDHVEEARARYEEALEIGREIDSPGAEGRARGLLGQLYLHEGNASYAAHLLREAINKLNYAGDIELTPLMVGLLGQASIENGQTAEGIHLIERALSLATHLGDYVSERRWASVLGDRALAEARIPDARDFYQRVLGRYNDQVTPERVLTETKLSRSLMLLHNYQDALAHAQTAVELSQTMEPGVQALASGALGMVLHSLGRHVEAIPHLRAAADNANGTRIDVLRMLAAAYAADGDSDTALATAMQAVHSAEQTGAPIEQAQAWRDLGLLYQRSQRPQDAIGAWATAIPLYEGEHAYAQVARLYCDTGTARKVLGQHPRALRDYEKALTSLNLVDQGDMETRGLVLSNAANAFAEQGDVDSADSFFNEAIGLADKLGDNAAASTRRSNYAYFLVQTGRPRRAITLLEEALRMSRRQEMALQTAIQLDNLGLARDAVADYEAARDAHQDALDMLATLDQPFWHTSALINLAHTQLAQEQIAAAETSFETALAEARAQEAVELIARAAIGLAQVRIAQHDDLRATALLDEATDIARRLDMRRWLASAIRTQSQLKASQGDDHAAEKLWEEAARYYNMLRMPQGKQQPTWLKPDTKA
ncbi:MAG: tetratricopeptide repeat protein [Anaerolineae bacterium]|nr:tetratricopeptide repeat protein [Anaerolineae bacterium]